MINANLLGRLGRDAELRYTPQSMPVLSFTVATDSGFGDKKKTVWVDAVMFGKRAESLSDMLPKGTMVLIRGELVPDVFKKQDGTEVHKLKMTVDSLEFAGSKQEQQSAPRQQPKQNYAPPPPPSGTNFEEDDIPFN